MRTLLLALIAAVVGALAAVQVAAALRERDAYPRGVMDVMAVHAGALDQAVKSRRCAADVTKDHFDMLVTMSGEIPRAFPELMPDKQFAKFASDAHSFDRQIAATPPNDCAGLQKTMAQIGEHCDQCHRVYR
ncbi:MAG TPA: cytochrome c [Rhodanobacteraceae bacterium]|nr:cytochrome c [Rhodanobacteraceae bacterium]